MHNRLASIAVAVFVAFSPLVARNLTFEDRVKAQEAIERVYYSHQIGATKPFEEALPKTSIEAKVRRYLEQSAMAVAASGKPITSATLRAEVDRMIGATQMPERLQQLFAALNDDPFLIEECLARPALIGRVHQKLIANGSPSRAEVAKPARSGDRADKPSSPISVVPTKSGIGPSCQVSCDADRWSAITLDGAPSGRYVSSAIWTGTFMVVWGGFDGNSQLNTGARYDPVIDVWTPTTTVDAPSPRSGHTAVWTGNRMAIWGGAGLNSGGLYDPIADNWTSMTTEGAPRERSAHVAVWTGTRMVVWGGRIWDGGNVYLDTGGVYDPVADQWTPTSIIGAPEGRSDFTAVWTGTRMLVWGGTRDQDVNTGGRYDPINDTWAPISSLDAPSPRHRYAAVWTGHVFVVWGGVSAGFGLITGGRYDPLADVWTTTTLDGVPGEPSETVAVWSGALMLLWGANTTMEGSRYDPVADCWKPTTSDGAPNAGGSFPLGVWNGTNMVVWGGTQASGGRYDPGSLDADVDGDEVGDRCDNCRETPNQAQQDADSDGWGDACDCRPHDPTSHPGAAEICDGTDNNCDGIVDNGPTESCNGLDDDCDGATDEGDPGSGAACSTGEPGVCSAGTLHCAAGSLACVRNVGPGPEVCNGLDDDCDGGLDEHVCADVSYSFTKIADTDTPIPGAEGNFYDFLDSPAIDHGVVAFVARAGPNWYSGKGIYKSIGGALNLVADKTTVTPGHLDRTFSDFGPPSLDGAYVAFWGGNGNDGIYSDAGGVLSRLVFAGDPVPGGLELFGALSSPSFDSGTIVFTASSSAAGVYAGWTNSFGVIANRSTWIPEGTDYFVDFGDAAKSGDKLAFVAYSGGGPHGVYTWSDGAFQVVADANTLNPETGVPFGSAWLRLPAISGENVALEAFLGPYLGRIFKKIRGTLMVVGPQPETCWYPEQPSIDGEAVAFHCAGYVHTDLGGAVNPVIGPGSILDGKTVADSLAGRESISGNQIAFRASFTDGSSGIYVATASDCGADGDCDGHPAGLDCDDTNPATFPGAAERNDGVDNQCPGDPGYGSIDEIADTLRMAPGGVCWTDSSGAATYEVALSQNPNLSPCQIIGTASSASPCVTVLSDPPPGGTFYYVVRATSPHLGSWGQDSTGAERLLSCP